MSFLPNVSQKRRTFTTSDDSQNEEASTSKRPGSQYEYPLNEEKYLCYSCNNWLINWHSLQALNSNDADSPSGTFRSHMNGMLYKEKSESQHQLRHFQFIKQTKLYNQRPIAKVCPLRIPTKTLTQTPASTKHSTPNVLRQRPSFSGHRTNILKFQRRCLSRPFHCGIFRMILRNLRLGQEFVTYKPWIGRFCIPSIKIIYQKFPRTLRTTEALKSKEGKNLYNSCKIKCSDDIHRKRQNGKESQRNLSKICISTICISNNHVRKFKNKVDTTDKNKQCLRCPLIDGKVVSMLRRLGTTLSHESLQEKQTTVSELFPRIMSPTKPQPRWIRKLDEDEIPLNFNNAISEVLPQCVRNQKQKNQYDAKCTTEFMATLHAKRKLAYHVSTINDNSQYILLPEGLSISKI
ncbi:protein phyllopod isoform X2 [Eurosta solidaginis]|uniref:protein phyllopod isoform X2 n=1 Tax=Eurosta solidaginis TaxID=178769 RepID=UPI0035309811